MSSKSKTEFHKYDYWIYIRVAMTTTLVIITNTLEWYKWKACTAWWIYKTWWHPGFTGCWCLVRTIQHGWWKLDTHCCLRNHHLRLLGQWIKVLLLRYSTNLVFLTNTNSQKWSFVRHTLLDKSISPLWHFELNQSSDDEQVVSKTRNCWGGISLVLLILINYKYGI